MSEDIIFEAISSFSCGADSDIEYFLKKFYSENKFSILQNKTENEENLLQMIRVLGK